MLIPILKNTLFLLILLSSNCIHASNKLNWNKKLTPALFEQAKAENKKELFDVFKENVIFICTSSYCSSPIFNEEDVDSYFTK